MPTYQYTCENCGYNFELFQSITAKSLRKCDKCGKRRLKRLIGAGAGIIFKGSGFYQTDYRSDSYKKAQKQEKETTGKKELKGKTEGSDSKPLPKTEIKSAEKTKSDKKKPA